MNSAVAVLLYVNFLADPVIYVLRMSEVRKFGCQVVEGVFESSQEAAE